ncbi:hypothetical protein OQZ55_00225 [Bacillus subtilis]|uniref:hypothetical protein n=1 Tax=Bacillus subtilis TaxID=1423 RepID=UPI00224CD2B1|nr:hypothetical protein [Bacillus subtilis]MCX4074741.1 hypothetical protein [Bacillus subtilis]MEC0395664.1 hypothetical protein [Bacillus subtilis]
MIPNMIVTHSLDEILSFAEMEFKDILENEFSLQLAFEEHPNFLSMIKNPFSQKDLYLYAVERSIHHVIEAVACEYIHEQHYHTAEEMLNSEYSDIYIEYDEIENSYIFESAVRLNYQINEKKFIYQFNIVVHDQTFFQQDHFQEFILNIEQTAEAVIRKEMSKPH